MTVKLRSFEINPYVEPTPDPTPTPTPTPEPKPDEPEPDPIEPTDPTPTPKEPEKVTPPNVDDDSDLNEPEVITLYETEYITVKKPAIVIEPAREKPRKKQIGLNVLTGGTVLAILVYIFIESIQKCRLKKQERKKVT